MSTCDSLFAGRVFERRSLSHVGSHTRRGFARHLVAAAACGLLWVLVGPADARAQVGFINPGAFAFEPEISIVNTGVVNDVQATVSADRNTSRSPCGLRTPNYWRCTNLRSRPTAAVPGANGGAVGARRRGAVNGVRLGFVGGIHFAEEAGGRFAPVRAHNRNDKPGEAIHPLTGTSAGGTVGAVVVNPPPGSGRRGRGHPRAARHDPDCWVLTFPRGVTWFDFPPRRTSSAV